MKKELILKENKMGIMPIRKLLITMSAPLIISMILQAMYNIVDSIFVSRINENALTAVSMVFPLQNLMIAVAMGTGVGVSALMSKSLGSKAYDKANNIAEHGIFLSWCCYALFLLFAIFGGRAFMSIQTNNAQIIEYGTSYLYIVCGLSIAFFSQVNFERLLQSTGKTHYMMYSQGVGAIVNIILDPILIFGLLGAPKMGIEGAAIATVLGQAIGACIGLTLNIKRNREIHFSMKHFRIKWNYIKEIYIIGFPSIIMIAIGSAMTFLMNLILVAFTTTAVATFGVYFKLNSIIFMPVFGFNNGLIPIVAYNYGAGNGERIDEAIKLCTKYSVILMTAGMLLFMIIPGKLLMLFDASETMLEIGTVMLRIIAIPFPLAAISIISSGAFQALGKSIYSMYISIARQLLVLLPVAYLLARLGNVDYVWLSFPIAEVVALSMSIHYRRKIKTEITSKLY